MLPPRMLIVDVADGRLLASKAASVHAWKNLSSSSSSGRPWTDIKLLELLLDELLQLALRLGQGVSV